MQAQLRLGTAGMLWLLVIVLASPTKAAPARMWFSISSTEPYKYSAYNNPSTQPRTVELDLSPGQVATLHLWAQPQTVNADRTAPYDSALNAFRQLINLSLDIAATGASASVDDFTFLNPGNVSAGDDPTERYRFVTDSANPRETTEVGVTGVLESVIYPRQQNGGVQGLIAYTPVPPAPFGSALATDGIGPLCESGCVPGVAGPAWLIGQLRVEAPAGSAGTTDFRLQVGSAGLAHAGELYDTSLADITPPQVLFTTQAIFGGDEGVVYDALADRQETLDGDSADLKVNVTNQLVGDYNADGVVNTADYTVWRDLVNTNDVLSNRSPSNSGAIGTADYNAWRLNYGSPLQTPSISVPEPKGLIAAVALVLAGLLIPKTRSITLALAATVCMLPSNSYATIWWDGGARTSSFGNTANWSTSDSGADHPSVRQANRDSKANVPQNDLEFGIAD